MKIIQVIGILMVHAGLLLDGCPRLLAQIAPFEVGGTLNVQYFSDGHVADEQKGAFRLSARVFRVAEAAWIRLVVSAAVCVCLLSVRISIVAATNTDNGLAYFLAIVTNCPPIDDLIIEVTDMTMTKTLYQFRYQDNAFFGRLILDIKKASQLGSDSIACGRWENEYWFYEANPVTSFRRVSAGAPAPRFYHSYVHRPGFSDTNNMAFDYVRQYDALMSLYTSYGIAGYGVNALRCQNGVLTGTNALFRRMIISPLSDIDIVDGLPRSAHTRQEMEPGSWLDSWSRYIYDTNAIPYPFPKSITVLVGRKHETRFYLRLDVLDLKLGSKANPRSRDFFVVTPQIFGSNVVRMFFTNGQNFFLDENHLVAMGGDPIAKQKLLERGGRPPRQPFVLLLLMTLLLPPIWAAIKIKHKMKGTRK